MKQTGSNEADDRASPPMIFGSASLNVERTTPKISSVTAYRSMDDEIH